MQELPPKHFADKIIDWFFSKLNYVRYPIDERSFRSCTSFSLFMIHDGEAEASVADRDSLRGPIPIAYDRTREREELAPGLHCIGDGRATRTRRMGRGRPNQEAIKSAIILELYVDHHIISTQVV